MKFLSQMKFKYNFDESGKYEQNNKSNSIKDLIKTLSIYA